MGNSNEFDRDFKGAAAKYFRADDSSSLVAWPWFKAQGIAESGLDPYAVSPAGAQGLMQLMPATARLMAKRLQVERWDPFSPEWSIAAGVRYDRHLWDIFKKEHGLERVRFVLGAYNAGPGNVIKAQRLTNRPEIWEAVSAQLPRITGQKNATETINYVRKIETIRLQIIED